ncbi:hypothetical protein CVU75_00345 [Candidatus Dependentiae bacterium HGW-Dependentiae-1]|nr:MAG: hypothetical protein CVU75_00345 [Candidatus Dependentiae bacterium HGW-Dependentiae-1]
MNKKSTLFLLAALTNQSLFAMEEDKPKLREENYTAMLANQSLAQLTHSQEESAAQLAKKLQEDKDYAEMWAQAGDEHTEK